MLTILATAVCLAFIAYLFWMDHEEDRYASRALWIPLIWMFLAGSRYLSFWLDPGVSRKSVETILDGSPLDAAFFILLIAAGTAVIIRRRVNWIALLAENPWIWLYFVFGLLSILWSDYPFVSFKRWVKATGNVVMVLVVLTDKNPYQAIGYILRRLTILFLPLSILFIKYYPEFGRGYTWSGKVMFSGVATQKNGLGQICLISSVYFCWMLLIDRWKADRERGALFWIVTGVCISMIAWLLYLSESATSLMCIIVAAVLFILSRTPGFDEKPERFLLTMLVIVVLLGVLEEALDLSETIIAQLGRTPTLTTRVPMWAGLLKMAEDPLLGVGYESFWLGGRLKLLWATYGQLIQAHNGYLEVYLNLGLIGLGIVLFSMLSGLLKIRRYFHVDYSAATLRLCFLVVVMLYNWTEATFYGLNNMWILFMLACMDPPPVLPDDEEA